VQRFLLEAPQQGVLGFRSGASRRRAPAQIVNRQGSLSHLSLAARAASLKVILNVRGVVAGECAQQVKLISSA
jgi:hypothetical protein